VSLPSLPGDKTCKHGVKTSRVPAIEKIQGGQICWQSNGYGVCDRKGVLLVDITEKGTKINAESYCTTLERLRVAINRQRPGLLTTGVLLLHDNARPHLDCNTALAALQVHNLGTSAIQPRSGAE
jgi:hypothetical protein